MSVLEEEEVPLPLLLLLLISLPQQCIQTWDQCRLLLKACQKCKKKTKSSIKVYNNHQNDNKYKYNCCKKTITNSTDIKHQQNWLYVFNSRKQCQSASWIMSWFWRTDGGTYDWQTADRSRAEHDTVLQDNTALAGSRGTAHPAFMPHDFWRRGQARRCHPVSIAPKLSLINVLLISGEKLQKLEPAEVATKKILSLTEKCNTNWNATGFLKGSPS